MTARDAKEGRRPICSWLMDMDGVLVHEEQAIPGADRFLNRLRERGLPFLVLTNNSIYTRRDLSARLRLSGLEVPEERIWTSANATAAFLESQRPGGSAFAIGEAGLTTALHGAGYTLTERSPDYVVLGETRTYSFEAITQAVRLIQGGARFIATNPDVTGPSRDGDLPATGAVAAMISAATEPVAGSGPSGEGPVTSGLVAMKRAPPPISRIARVIASNEYVRVSSSTT